MGFSFLDLLLHNYKRLPFTHFPMEPRFYTQNEKEDVKKYWKETDKKNYSFMSLGVRIGEWESGAVSNQWWHYKKSKGDFQGFQNQ